MTDPNNAKPPAETPTRTPDEAAAAAAKQPNTDPASRQDALDTKPPADTGPVDHFHAAQRDLRAAATALVAEADARNDPNNPKDDGFNPVRTALIGVGDSAAVDLFEAIKKLGETGRLDADAGISRETSRLLRQAFPAMADALEQREKAKEPASE